MASFAFRSAADLIRLYRQGDASPREVTDALLARIARLNPLLHAFLTVTADQARAQAATAEARYRDARRDGTLDALPPLLGVPLSVKDLSPVAGVRTTYGSLIYADHLPSETAIAAERLEAAGAVLLGKSNTPEFGTTTVTDNRLGPSCANPWNPGHVAGGSSGGAAAAVAAGLGPLAHGSDGGGSIRVPAAFNGVVGVKPSQTRIPRLDEAIGMRQFSTEGPLARTVGDAALMLQVMAGPDPRDLRALLDSPADYQAACTQTDLRDLRLAWSPDLGYATVASPVLANAQRALKALGDHGAQIEAATPQTLSPFDIFTPIFLAGFVATYGDLYDTHGDLLTPYVRRAIETGRKVDAVTVVRAYAHLERFRAQMRDFFRRYDLLITPATAVPPFPHGVFVKEIEGKPALRFWGATPFSVAFNLTLQPAASIPSGWTADGLPTALQIVGRFGEESTVLRAAAALEESLPWADRYPPLASDT